MSDILKDIRSVDPRAADELKRADVHTDSDLRSLTREDLRDLFPGVGALKRRRTIFEIIHKRKSFGELLRGLKGFIPHDNLRAALTDNGVLVDYLHILKDTKAQVDSIQCFLDAHVDFLEEFIKNPPEQESARGTSDTSGQTVPHNGKTGGHQQGSESSSDTSGQMVPYNDKTGGHQQGSESTSDTCCEVMPYNGPTGTYRAPTGFSLAGFSLAGFSTNLSPQYSQEAIVTYQTVVSGKTFGAHKELIDKVTHQCQNRVRLIDSSDDAKITIVFCPITSRILSDVEAAMADVKDKITPVILVLMHHTHQPKCTTSVKTWSGPPKVELEVNIFYHDSVHGLLTCQQNNDAVSEILNKLLKYKTMIHKDTRGNVLAVSAESVRLHR